MNNGKKKRVSKSNEALLHTLKTAVHHVEIPLLTRTAEYATKATDELKIKAHLTGA